MCTATAVSHNTLLYAAHCSDAQTGRNGRINQKICVRKNLANEDSSAIGACADAVYIHPNYRGGSDFSADVAVAVFPDNTFKNYFPVQANAPKIGSKVFMVGFSSENLDESGKGSKRWGYNQIRSIDSDSAFITSYRNTIDGVAVSPGDSGGPLFSDCKVVGVASRMGTGGTKYSLHTNITIQTNVAWMQTLQREEGAKFCGLSGVYDSSCNPAQMGGWDSKLQNSTQSQEFPCAPSSDMDPSQSLTQMYVALGEPSGNSTPLHIATSIQGAETAKICDGSDPCQTNDHATLTKTASGVSFFAPILVTIKDGQILRAEVYDKSSKLLESRVIRFVRK